MSNKWVNPQPKLVPQPYTNLLTERDIGRPPILRPGTSALISAV